MAALAVNPSSGNAQQPVLDKKFQDSKIPENLEGVAVTLMLRAPQWFHCRYTLMLHNILANLPMNWVVQVVVNVDWIQKDILPLHPGLQTLLLAAGAGAAIDDSSLSCSLSCQN
jgi:hypothetical protein